VDGFGILIFLLLSLDSLDILFVSVLRCDVSYRIGEGPWRSSG